MSYDYHHRQVWLGDLAPPIDPGSAYAMCERHANRLTPPVGWLLNDRRSVLRPLFFTQEVA